MHDIEPWWGWRDEYSAENDHKSPFYGTVHSEFHFTHKIYNYYIHPQWDFFGSETLYGKLLYTDYRNHFALLELIGEWNDCLGNDVMFLKRDFADQLIEKGISKFVIFCDNVLNFHGDEDCYYEEWYDDVKDDGGWICFVNTYEHVLREMEKFRLHHYVNLGENYNDMNWRTQKPVYIVQSLEELMGHQQKLIF